MLWINLLHIYQPPTQKKTIIRKIAKECYGPLAEGLRAHPKAKFVLNINASLTEQLAAEGFDWIIGEYRAAAERGQIAFTGSAAYHAILPLIPEAEAERQIELNTRINRRYFGDTYRPRGFFPPEMSYSHNIAVLVKKLGFSWMFVDELGFNGAFGSADYRSLYRLKREPGLHIFFRNRKISDKMAIAPITTPKRFMDTIRLATGAYAVTALDGEAYGHHKKDFGRILFETYDALPNGGLEAALPDDLLGKRMPEESVDPLPCSWATMEGDLTDGLSYGLWNDPDNDIHRLQWKLTHLAFACLAASARNTPDHETNAKWQEARSLLDKGVYSDQYWWAAGRKGFGTISIQWLPGMIIAGVDLLTAAIAAAPDAGERFSAEAEKISAEIRETIQYWNKNRIYNKYKKRNLND